MTRTTTQDPQPAEGTIELLLHSDFHQGLSGWDRETRIVRARGIAKALPK
jgi:hypothetical protein